MEKSNLRDRLDWVGCGEVIALLEKHGFYCGPDEKCGTLRDILQHGIERDVIQDPTT